MVLVALGHADDAVHEGIVPVGRRSQGATQTVGLAVGLVHDVEAQRVAQLIPARRVGVVRQAHGIEVGRLHESDVFQHALFGHYARQLRVVLMAVGTAQAHGAAVDQQLSVLDLQPAEAHLLFGLFQQGAIGPLQLQTKGVEIGRLGRPLVGLADRHADAVELAIAALRKPRVHAACLVLQVEHLGSTGATLGNALAVGVVEGGHDSVAASCLVAEDAQLRIDLQ